MLPTSSRKLLFGCRQTPHVNLVDHNTNQLWFLSYILYLLKYQVTPM
jgi:hypothetical protein